VIKHQTSIKIRYAETDQMGYVHHSNYALYLEEARMELLKRMGIDCAQMERDGIIMPVAEMKTVETELMLPLKSSLEFRYRIYNQDNRLVSRSRTRLVFADKESGKLLSNPQKYLESFITYNQQSL
jgi:acyl-CoA thioester hydrolase